MIIDTHALIWFLEGDIQLPETAISAIENNSGQNFISMASLWEIGIKSSLGKLELLKSFPEMLNFIRQNGFKILPISEEDVAKVIALPFYHRDPFDRMLIAQSLNLNIPILTKDQHFKAYSVNLIW